MIKQKIMKTTALVLSLFLATFCMAQETKQAETSESPVEINKEETDSAEYEILIIELGYENYLVTQPPMNFYTEQYYKNWNTWYVAEYNHRYISGPRREIYEHQIDYNSQIRYGLEVEYKLYHYFRYFEKKYGVTLVSRGK